MEITVTRILKTNNYTIGELSVNGKYLMDTLEDRVRPLPDKCPNTPKGINCNCKEKVYGKTAVPAGTYEVRLSYSNRFRRVLPELLDVPHFLGIRIHSGNKSTDTEGCLLVGEWDNEKGDWVANSRQCFNRLFSLLQKAADNKEKITITINNL